MGLIWGVSFRGRIPRAALVPRPEIRAELDMSDWSKGSADQMMILGKYWSVVWGGLLWLCSIASHYSLCQRVDLAPNLEARAAVGSTMNNSIRINFGTLFPIFNVLA